MAKISQNCLQKYRKLADRNLWDIKGALHDQNLSF